MKAFRKDEGFTLVELMVVVLIIGILVAIAIPVFNAAKANAQKKSCFGNQRTIEGACQSYNAEYGVLPASANTLVTNAALPGLVSGSSYIKSDPLCTVSQTNYMIDASGTVQGDNSAATWVTNHTHY